METLEKINTWVIDVDGTLTDGGIYYDEKGNEIKKFCTKDAAAFFVCNLLAMKTIVLTGRKCDATEKRMKELKVSAIEQGVGNKQEWLEKYMKDNNISKYEVGYIGDDLNDYAAMRLCGFVGCPQTACREVKEIADYVSPLEGGTGAVRDVIEYVLLQRGVWNTAVCKVYNISQNKPED